jgi:hypothetical protein
MKYHSMYRIGMNKTQVISAVLRVAEKGIERIV